MCLISEGMQQTVWRLMFSYSLYEQTSALGVKQKKTADLFLGCGQVYLEGGFTVYTVRLCV